MILIFYALDIILNFVGVKYEYTQNVWTYFVFTNVLELNLCGYLNKTCWFLFNKNNY